MLNKKFLPLLLTLLLSPLFLFATDYSTVSSSFSFSRNLGVGNRGQDVENLQCILGIGTPTGYFGPITKQALTDFQNAHVSEILAPVGLSAGTGYMGESTRTYLNTQISSQGSTSTPTTCPTYNAPTPNPSIYTPPNQTAIPTTNPVTPTTNTTCPQGYNCAPACPQGYSCAPNNQQGYLPNTPTFGSTGNGAGNPYAQPSQPTYSGPPMTTVNQQQPVSGNTNTAPSPSPAPAPAPTPAPSPTGTNSGTGTFQTGSCLNLKLFALGDSIAREYQQQIGGGGTGGDGAETNNNITHNRIGAIPLTIRTFQQSLTSDQLNYIKSNGIAVFSGTNDIDEYNETELTIASLIKTNGVPAKGIYLVNVSNSVRNTSKSAILKTGDQFNQKLKDFVTNDPDVTGIHLVDISQIHADVNSHPDLQPFLQTMKNACSI
jgi:hypothetical protein